ncbi:MAG: hypothetical protein OXF02_00735 [Simkaniaceae bacterium]|nr:hypothetical protein [Simkaniaceae bacterium]
MVKECYIRTEPVIAPMEPPSPVVTNQPVIPPAGANHPAGANQQNGNAFLAPAVAVDNVAQRQWGTCKKAGITLGAIVGETLVGGSCGAGVVFCTGEIAGKTGATVAVTEGVAATTGTLVGLCAIGAMVATAGYYIVNECKQTKETVAKRE